jgi:hypothetical protein
MKEKTYFGLEVYDDNEKYVLESDIKKLPFYAFWKKSLRGKTCLILAEDSGIFLHDWESFCKLFIETGKHRLLD